MKKLLILSLCFVLLICTAVTVSATKWTDVPDDIWYTAAVVKANELGIMNGTSDTTFAPLKNLTRAEYVAILFRLSGGEANLEFGFTDVPSDAWYKQYVGWAEKSRVITGYGNPETFGGNQPITREQLMLMTARYMNYEGVHFDDAANAVDFKDADKISSWAADGVEITRRAGLITGDSNGNFNPQSNATRAEIATIVVRYVESLTNAKDIMHIKLDNILSLVETQSGKHIRLEFSGASEITDNYYNNTSFRQQLFPQMGLDLDTYETVISREDLELFKEAFPTIKSGAFVIKQIDFAIRNKIRGEVTETVKLSFMLRKVDPVYVNVDPDNFDHGFDTEVYNKALDISLRSEGNIARLAAFFDKAEKGEGVTVGYIGGSITQGASSQPGQSWAETTQRWIEKHVDANAKYINTGIGGSSSALGLLRVENELLLESTDLVFVEYAVNDNQNSDYHRRTFEALIRRLLEDENAPAVVIVLCVCDSDAEDRYAYMESVAEYYDIPTVDTRRGVYHILNNSEMTYYDFANDNVHPQSFGHRIMGDMVINLLKTVKENAKTATAAELKITAPVANWITDDLYNNLTYCNPQSFLLMDENCGWESKVLDDAFCFNNSIATNSSSNVLTFNFTGRCLTVALYTAPIYIEVSIDGGEYFKVSCGNGFRVELQEVCKFDSVGNHTVKVRLSPDNNGSECNIVGFGIG